MKLKELQKLIPKVETWGKVRMGCDIIIESPLRGSISTEIATVWGDGGRLESEAKLNAALIMHSVKTLPKVLEVLKVAQVRIFMLEGRSEDYMQINTILAAAEEVEGI